MALNAENLGREDWGAWSCALREAIVCSRVFNFCCKETYCDTWMTPKSLGFKESESRLTQKEDESTGECSLEEGISTGILADWPGIRRKGSEGTFTGAPAAASFGER